MENNELMDLLNEQDYDDTTLAADIAEGLREMFGQRYTNCEE